MARYPNFVVAEYYDILNKIYGWPPERIEKHTGILFKAVPRKSLERYGNDKHVLRMIQTLDELGYFRTQDLVFYDEKSRAAFGLQSPATAMRLVIAELRNCETVFDYFTSAANRMSRIGPASKYWVEQHGAKTKFCHQYFYDEEKFSGPQRTFVFLLQNLFEVLRVARSDVKITFPGYGIRDARGFLERTGCAIALSGSISSIEIDESEVRYVNPSFNRFSKLSVSEAIDDLLVSERVGVLEAVETILKDTIESSNRSLDIEAVAKLMGISRVTLHRRLKDEGQSFRDLRSKVRLSHASKLLRNTILEISEISEILDYSEPSAFCRAFKIHTGCSPNEFRITQSPYYRSNADKQSLV